MGQVLSARLSHIKVVSALWCGAGGPSKAVQHALDMDDQVHPKPPKPRPGRRLRKPHELDMHDFHVELTLTLTLTLTLGLALALVLASTLTLTSSPSPGHPHPHQALLVDLINATQPKLHTHLGIDLATEVCPAIALLIDSEYEDYLLAGLQCATAVLRSVGPVMREAAEAARYQGMFRHGPDVAFEERQERCATLAEQLRSLQPRLEQICAGRGRAAQLAQRLCRSLARALDGERNEQ